MTEDIVKLCKRLMGHPVICMDKQNITGDAAATIEALTKSLDIQIESSSTYARELEAEIERLTLDINALIKIDALNTAEIERLRNTWQPSETAPKETDVLVWCGWRQTAIFTEGCFMTEDKTNPIAHVTHWMPLPEPPKGEDHEND